MLRGLVVTSLLFFLVTTMEGNSEPLQDRVPPMSFEVRDGTVYGTGLITRETPARFDSFAVNWNLKGTTIAIDSPGGLVRPGLQLGRKIRQLEMNTKVPEHGVCESMCVYLLGAGVKRTVAKTGAVKVHQIYVEAKGTDDKILYTAENIHTLAADIGAIAAYLTEMGVSGELVEISMNHPPWEPIYRLTRDEMTRTRLIN